MTRVMLASLALAIAAPLLNGCAQTQAVPVTGYYAPYDQQTNPFCGAVGTCQPLNTRPYPMQGTVDGGG